MTAAALKLLSTVGAQAPTPPPTPEEFTIYNVTPGISGFIAFFVLALVGWVLFRSLVRHMRKVDMAEAQRQRAAAEAEGRSGQVTTGQASSGQQPSGQPTE